jgi:hypothetical protein
MLETLEALAGPLSSLVDVTALVLVIKLGHRVNAIARRVGAVERRTPPMGVPTGVVDIKSGPTTRRAATEPGKR